MILRLLVLLLTLAGAAAAAAAWQISQDPPPELPQVTGPGRVDTLPVGPNAPEIAARTSFGDLATRPPFAPERRYAEPEAATPAEPDTPAARGAPNVRLLGIVRDGGEHIAVVATVGQPSTLILRRGGTIEGWSVESIDDARVMLRNGDDTFEIRLFKVE